jgi:hypothetical protein
VVKRTCISGRGGGNCNVPPVPNQEGCEWVSIAAVAAGVRHAPCCPLSLCSGPLIRSIAPRQGPFSLVEPGHEGGRRKPGEAFPRVSARFLCSMMPVSLAVVLC